MAHKPLRRQNQHELPELYLEAFCDPAEPHHVWLFVKPDGLYSPSRRRGKGNPFLSGIHRTAALENRYAGRKLDGTLDVDGWEQRLQKREHAVDGVLTRIRAKQVITAAEKEPFADYLLLMWLRVSKRWQERLERATHHVSRVDFDQIARGLAFTGHITGARQIYDAKSFLTSKAGIRHLVLNVMLEEMRRCRGVLLGMTWNFLSAPADHFFVTCDAPFIFDEALGLRSSHVQFPISPKITLVAGHGDPLRAPYDVISSDETLKLNVITIRSAHREVYAPAKDEWIYNAWRYGVTFDASGGHVNGPHNG